MTKAQKARELVAILEAIEAGCKLQSPGFYGLWYDLPPEDFDATGFLSGKQEVRISPPELSVRVTCTLKLRAPAMEIPNILLQRLGPDTVIEEIKPL